MTSSMSSHQRGQPSTAHTDPNSLSSLHSIPPGADGNQTMASSGTTSSLSRLIAFGGKASSQKRRKQPRPLGGITAQVSEEPDAFVADLTNWRHTRYHSTAGQLEPLRSHMMSTERGQRNPPWGDWRNFEPRPLPDSWHNRSHSLAPTHQIADIVSSIPHVQNGVKSAQTDQPALPNQDSSAKRSKGALRRIAPWASSSRNKSPGPSKSFSSMPRTHNESTQADFATTGPSARTQHLDSLEYNSANHQRTAGDEIQRDESKGQAADRRPTIQRKFSLKRALSRRQRLAEPSTPEIEQWKVFSTELRSDESFFVKVEAQQKHGLDDRNALASGGAPALNAPGPQRMQHSTTVVPRSRPHIVSRKPVPEYETVQSSDRNGKRSYTGSPLSSWDPAIPAAARRPHAPLPSPSLDVDVASVNSRTSHEAVQGLGLLPGSPSSRVSAQTRQREWVRQPDRNAASAAFAQIDWNRRSYESRHGRASMDFFLAPPTLSPSMVAPDMVSPHPDGPDQATNDGSSDAPTTASVILDDPAEMKSKRYRQAGYSGAFDRPNLDKDETPRQPTIQLGDHAKAIAPSDRSGRNTSVTPHAHRKNKTYMSVLANDMVNVSLDDAEASEEADSLSQLVQRSSLGTNDTRPPSRDFSAATQEDRDDRSRAIRYSTAMSSDGAGVSSALEAEVGTAKRMALGHSRANTVDLMRVLEGEQRQLPELRTGAARTEAAASRVAHRDDSVAELSRSIPFPTVDKFKETTFRSADASVDPAEAEPDDSPLLAPDAPKFVRQDHRQPPSPSNSEPKAPVALSPTLSSADEGRFPAKEFEPSSVRERRRGLRHSARAAHKSSRFLKADASERTAKRAPSKREMRVQRSRRNINAVATTSEEAMQAWRAEEARRKKRQARQEKKEREKIEKRVQDHIAEKQSSPLLAARLHLIGLSPAPASAARPPSVTSIKAGKPSVTVHSGDTGLQSDENLHDAPPYIERSNNSISEGLGLGSNLSRMSSASPTLPTGRKDLLTTPPAMSNPRFRSESISRTTTSSHTGTPFSIEFPSPPQRPSTPSSQWGSGAQLQSQNFGAGTEEPYPAAAEAVISSNASSVAGGSAHSTSTVRPDARQLGSHAFPASQRRSSHNGPSSAHDHHTHDHGHSRQRKLSVPVPRVSQTSSTGPPTSPPLLIRKVSKGRATVTPPALSARRSERFGGSTRPHEPLEATRDVTGSFKSEDDLDRRHQSWVAVVEGADAGFDAVDR